MIVSRPLSAVRRLRPAAARIVFLSLFIHLSPCLADTVPAPMSPPWPMLPKVRQEFDFNQGWRFMRVDHPAVVAAPPQVVYVPPTAGELAHGAFTAAETPQDTMLPAGHSSRFVALQALSDQTGQPFASIAEFYLLGKDGNPLPREAWKVAYADSVEVNNQDLASNAIDGDTSSMWHTEWSGKQPPMPHIIIFDLGQTTTYYGFRYLARQDGNDTGMIKDWAFYGLSSAPKSYVMPSMAALTPELASRADWPLVNLPHAVRLEPLNASGGKNFQGVCWYTKQFPLKPEWKGKTIYLRFDGAMSVADVWLNGVHLATHYCGYLPFTVPISPAANFNGDNLLVVRLDNSDNPEVPPGKPQSSLDFAYFGGLYRGVHLDVLDPVHISDPILANKVAGGGVFVTYPKVAADDSTVEVQTDVANDSAAQESCSVTQQLIAPDGSVAGTASTDTLAPAKDSVVATQQIDVPSPKLWHPFHPYLYVLHTVVDVGGVPVDDLYTRIGIRSFRFVVGQGLFINGEHFVSIGANRHQDHPYVGYAIPASDQYRDAKLLRDAGMTSYRSHYPMDQSWMDACDQLGILAIVSNPGWQFMGDELFRQRVYQDCRDMIRWNRNHASVVLWEADLNETDDRLAAPTLYKVVHAEYPGDGVYASGNHIDPSGDFPGWDVEYSGQVPTKPGWWREWGDQVDNWGDQQSDSRIDRTWGETAMLEQALAHTQRLNGVLAGAIPAAGQKYGWLSGADLWAGIDCYRGYHHQPFLGGPIDLFRIPKFDYYMFESQRPAQDLNIPGVDGGPMVFVANYATLFSPTTITVYSNCEQVRLTENGKVVGTQSPDPGYDLPHPPFTFHIGQLNSEESMLFAPGGAQRGSTDGEILAEGLIGGQVAATCDVKTPGVPSQLILTADFKGRPLTADGSDWIRVYAKVCDSHGTVYPMADDIVTFKVSGPGAVIGDASIGANPTAARAGIATALIQATTQPGDITVTASGFGLTDGTVVIHSVPNEAPVWPIDRGLR